MLKPRRSRARKREAGKAISNRSMLEEIRDRDETIKQLQRQKKKKQKVEVIKKSTSEKIARTDGDIQSSQTEIQSPETTAEAMTKEAIEAEVEEVKASKPVPYVRVHDYEQLKREAGLLL